MTQGVLPFQYEEEKSQAGMTALAGLPAYLDLAAVSGLTESIRQHMTLGKDKTQGWSDSQIITSLVMLNLAGGDCVDDLRVLEGDEGFARIMRRVETQGLPRKERRALEKRWRKERRRSVPSPSSALRDLSAFHNEEEEKVRQTQESAAFIPQPNKHREELSAIKKDLIELAQQKAPLNEATLDQDATLVETHEHNAKHGYKGFKAYQPLNT